MKVCALTGMRIYSPANSAGPYWQNIHHYAFCQLNIHFGEATAIARNFKASRSTVRQEKYSAMPRIWLEMQRLDGQMSWKFSPGEWALYFGVPGHHRELLQLFWLCPDSFFGQTWPNFFRKPLPLCLGFWPHLKIPERASKELQRKRTGIINYTISEILGLDSKNLREVVGSPKCFTL